MQPASAKIIQILASVPEGMREEVIREVFTTIMRRRRRAEQPAAMQPAAQPGAVEMIRPSFGRRPRRMPRFIM